MPATKPKPELLMPDHKHLACSARLAAVIASAWFEHSGQSVDSGSLLVTVPEGGQKAHDVYRATVQFRSDGMIVVIDSWSTCTQMCRAGKVYIDEDFIGDIEVSHMPYQARATAPENDEDTDDEDTDPTPYSSKRRSKCD